MLFLETGGTVDKMPVFKEDGVTFDRDSKVFKDKHLEAMLRETGLLLPERFEIVSPFMIDSLDMTEGHRELLDVIMHGSSHQEVVITHGTDTMIDTALSLQRRRERLGEKTIVLTGAMNPYSIGAVDAVPNLRAAILTAHRQEPGVYIAMNDEVFDPDNVYKDYPAQLFRRLR